MTAVPAEAITAAAYVLANLEGGHNYRDVARDMLEAAEPHLAAARVQVDVGKPVIRHGDRVAVRVDGRLTEVAVIDNPADLVIYRTPATQEFSEHDLAELEQALAQPYPEDLAAARQRIAELEQLAGELLDAYTKGSDGYRARVGAVQIERWQRRLAGQQ